MKADNFYFFVVLSYFILIGGCTSDITTPISEIDSPISRFEIDTVSSREYRMINLSKYSSSFQWNFGDSEIHSEEISPTHFYLEPGDYVISLKSVRDGLSDSSFFGITIDSLKSDFLIEELENGRFKFSPVLPGDTLYWDFGDNKSSNEDTVIHSYEAGGEYLVTLISPARKSDGTQLIPDETQKSVTVVQPEPQFSWEPAGDASINFSNESVNTLVSTWFLGSDNGIKIQGDFTHDFQQTGTYSVKLVAMNGVVTDTLVSEVQVQDAVIADFEVTEIQNGEYGLINTSSGATGFEWNFGNGQTTNVENPANMTYTEGGNFQIRLIAIRDEMKDTAFYDLTVIQPQASFQFEIQDISGNKDEYRRVVLINESTNSTVYEWDFGDNSTSKEINPTHDYGIDGSYEIRLVSKNGVVESQTLKSLQINNWQLVTEDAGFPGRWNSTMVEFNDFLWVIGGYVEGEGVGHDIWRSQDGISWVEVTHDLTVDNFGNVCACVFNNKLWIMGGLINGTSSNRVFSSEDGFAWSESNDGSKFPNNSGSNCQLLNDRIYIFLTAIVSNNPQPEVWSSSDGDNWVLESIPAIQADFVFRTSAVLNNKLWIIGGDTSPDNDPVSEVWSSSNGNTWSLETNSPNFGRIGGQVTVSYDDRIWLIGGNIEDLGSLNNGSVWSSSDGITWHEEVYLSPSEIRAITQATGFNGSLFVIVGRQTSFGRTIWKYDTN